MQEAPAVPEEVEIIRLHANALAEMQSKISMLSCNGRMRKASSALCAAHNLIHEAQKMLKHATKTLVEG